MNSSSVLIIAFLCIAIGYFAGVLISNLLDNRSKNEDQADQTIQDDPEVMPAPNEKTPSDQVHLSHLPGSQDLDVDLGGNHFSRPADVNPEQQERLVIWLAEFRAFLGAAKLEATQKSTVSPDGIPRADSQSDLRKVAPEILITSMPGIQGGISYTPPNPKPAPSAATQSIVSQIDEILQTQIDGTRLAERGLRLAELPGHGVSVWIGIQQYQEIDQVDDPEAKDAIRKAVRAWELKTR